LSVGAVFLFVWQFGLVGAPLGLMVGVCLISLPANLRVLARESNITVWKLMKPLAPWFVRFTLLMFAAGTFARFWSPETIPLLVATVVLGALVYIAVMFPVVLSDPLGLYLRPRLFILRARMFSAFRLPIPFHDQ
jgi:hypothetical protein